MTSRPVKNVAASARQRLLNQARADGKAFQELATLYAMERFLFRLASSPHAQDFILKGGLMTLTWAGDYGRVTRDIDLLGRGDNSVDAITTRIATVLRTEVDDDGVGFDTSSLRGEEITVDSAYVGARVRFKADLAGMLLPMQCDIGFGDAVVPPAEWMDYPQLLDFGCPRVLGYPVVATIAEKLHAACVLGLTNSRMKDFYDIWSASRLGLTAPDQLGPAIVHTFARRGTTVPTELPEGLSAAFAAEPSKQTQWSAFLRKSRLDAPELDVVVMDVARVAEAAFEAAQPTN